jgi:hypothetical protein
MKTEELKESSLHRYIVASLKFEGWREQAAELKAKGRKAGSGAAKLCFKFQTQAPSTSEIPKTDNLATDGHRSESQRLDAKPMIGSS